MNRERSEITFRQKGELIRILENHDQRPFDYVAAMRRHRASENGGLSGEEVAIIFDRLPWDFKVLAAKYGYGIDSDEELNKLDAADFLSMSADVLVSDIIGIETEKKS